MDSSLQRPLDQILYGIAPKVGLPELCKEANKNELVDILVRVSRQKKGAEKKITTLQKLAEQSAGVKHAGQALWKCLSRAVLQIQALEASLQELEQEMFDALEPVPYADNLTSLKDLGLTAAAALVGELGGIENYDHVEQAYKMAGLNLYQVTSGSQEVEEKKIKRKITKRGRSRLRKILYFAALRCVKKDGCFRKYYEHLLAKGKHKEVALVAVCRKLLRVLFSLVKNNTRFDPSQHQSQGVERN